jgi:DNA recombination protein RmuC
MAVLLALLAAVVAAGLAAAVVARLTTTRFAERATAEREAAVAAAIEAVVAQAGHAFVAEREHTLRAAVESATSVASSKLQDSMTAGSRELDLRSRSFEQQVAHISDALGTLGGLVHELQKERVEQTGSLVAQLEHVTRTQQTLAEHTDQLRQALASPKQRGQWGERMAEDVLRAAGFREGVNYRRQTAIEGGTIPDFRFLLPRDLELRMDVKFPVDNYLRVLEADSDDVRARHTKAFVADVRTHVRGLAGRGYIDHRDTVDCLLLFIPNEAVYAFLHEADPDVVDVALGQQVVLCSPSTLFAVLAVVRRSVEQFQLERRSDEILRCLGGISSEWDKFTGALDKVGRQLDGVHKAFNDELNGTRRRVFQRSLDEIESLQSAGELPALSKGEALAAQKAAGDVRPLPVEVDDPDGVAEAG